MTNEPPREPFTQGRRAFQRQVRDLRDRELVQTAARLVLANGCSEVRVDDVASECGVAKGTCYQHFGSKSALLSAAVASLDDEFARHLSTVTTKRRNTYAAAEASVLEAVKAIMGTLLFRTHASTGTGRDARALEKPWPCCLRFTRCPHGGGAASLKVLGQLVRGATQGATDTTDLWLELVLTVPIVLSRNGEGERLSGQTVRGAARRTLRQLLPPTAPTSTPRRSRSTR